MILSSSIRNSSCVVRNSIGIYKILFRDYKDYGKTRKKNIKTKEDRLWNKKLAMNPFSRNVGLARQLKGLEIGVEDSILKSEDINDVLGNIDATLENKKTETLLHKQVNEDYKRILTTRKIIKKKVFPTKQNPLLLTWMEKEMIKYLHKKDPIEWSIERLSESFPATTSVIVKVLKSRTVYEPEKIRKYNDEVTTNWKLLSKGQIQLDADYEKHLRTSKCDISMVMTAGERNLVEQEISLNSEKSIALPKPTIPGEFASIIIDYNKKIRNKNQDQKDSINLLEMSNLFGENTIPGTPLENQVSAYSDTALIATSIDLKKEKQMDVEKFRKEYLSEHKGTSSSRDRINEYKEKYMKWVSDEARRSKFVNVESVSQSDVNILDGAVVQNSVIKSIQKEESIKVSESETGHTFIYNQDKGYSYLSVSNKTQDKLDVPENLRKNYNFFQVEDTLYDKNGNMLYRIPGQS